jgi:hypothetical protein
MSLNSIRQSVLANFSKLSPHLVGEFVTEVPTHETDDRFKVRIKVVMPLLKRSMCRTFWTWEVQRLSPRNQLGEAGGGVKQS